MNEPLESWSLAKVKEHCGSTTCCECFLWVSESEVCLFDKEPPCHWDLKSRHRWTKCDIEDAKAIKRVHPYALAVERRENYANPLVLTNGRGDIKSVYPGLISSLKPGECVDLQEILDAEVEA